MQGKFVWYELMTNDVPAAAAFYRDVIGWEAKAFDGATAQGSAYTVFNIPGREMGSAGLMAITPEMAQNGAMPQWYGYVAVDDVDAKAREFVENGGRVLMPGTDIPGIGRFAVVADPHGAVLDVFKPNMPEGPLPEEPPPMSPGTVGWHELMAGDGNEAFDFYARMFGWTKGEPYDMGAMGVYQLFAHDGMDIGGMMTKTPDMPHPFWSFYFVVPEIDAAMKRVTDAGGTVLSGPMEVPGGAWVIQCRDPQGAFFALVAGKR
ncbi:VOC family protein [Ciceribacter thiooxidans]|uniref:VOC family protein n=1 Tax=Ciceribacter thiooxidans TaxID=1969821 RepID=A0ABV7I1X5_9HYPH|nr:VOC family protein [Ciceribacter thiooxidans]